MRRLIAVLLLGALTVVCCPRMAVASSRSVLQTPAFDLRTQLLKRFFGETAGESPLRGFAFDASLATMSLDALPAVSVNVPDVRLPLATIPRLSLSVPANIASSALWVNLRDDATPAPVLGFYRGLDAQPTAAPASVRFNLTTPAQQFAGSALTTLAPLDFSAGLPAANATVNVPVRVGRFNVQGRVEGAQSLATGSSLRDKAFGAGANFNVHAGKGAINVDVANNFEHLARNDSPFASGFNGSSTWQLSNDNLPLLVPAFSDVSKHTISAGLAVPVSRRLTAGVQYDTQHLLGGYGSPGLNNLDARNDVYGAKLTYQLPNSSSLITFSAKQYRYQDNLISSNTFTQTREDVNFTVKF